MWWWITKWKINDFIDYTKYVYIHLERINQQDMPLFLLKNQPQLVRIFSKIDLIFTLGGLVSDTSTQTSSASSTW